MGKLNLIFFSIVILTSTFEKCLFSQVIIHPQCHQEISPPSAIAKSKLINITTDSLSAIITSSLYQSKINLINTELGSILVAIEIDTFGQIINSKCISINIQDSLLCSPILSIINNLSPFNQTPFWNEYNQRQFLDIFFITVRISKNGIITTYF